MEPKHPRKLTDQDFIDMHFINYWDAMSKSVYDTAVEKGWHETERPITEYVANFHDEVSEFFKAHAKHNPPDDKLPNHDSATVELADLILRIMDFATHEQLPLAMAIVDKNRFNKTRDYRHGGKKF